MTQPILDALPLPTRSVPAGPFTPAIAARAGVTRTMLDRWVRDGQVVRLFRGVYLAADRMATREVRAAALGLVLGRTQRVVGRTAAWLHGCAPSTFIREGGGEVEAVPLEFHPAAGRWPPGGTPGDRDEVHGIATLTPAATAADLLERLAPGAALAALDGLLRCGALRHRDLTERCGPGPHGDLAARADARAAGPAESVLRGNWLDARLPTPIPGALIHGHRVALALPVQRFAVTLAGTAPEGAAAAWRSRGWGVTVVDAAHVLRAEPDQIRAHLEREFHRHLLEEVNGPRRLPP